MEGALLPFFKVQHDTVNNLITLVIFQPFISLDKTDRALFIFISGENKKQQSNRFIFPSDHTEDSSTIFSLTEQFYKLGT